MVSFSAWIRATVQIYRFRRERAFLTTLYEARLAAQFIGLNVKHSAAAVKREAEEDWAGSRRNGNALQLVARDI